MNRQRPHLGDDGQGTCAEYAEFIRDYLRKLADRLRRVRVCCGDWSRVCGPTPTINMGEPTGVFLDPPYSLEAGRDMRCYAVDCGRVAHDVREWALERSNDKRYRIVLAGYEGEHAMPDSWRCVAWKAYGGMANIAHAGRDGTMNYTKERLWFSPHCLRANEEACLFVGATP